MQGTPAATSFPCPRQKKNRAHFEVYEDPITDSSDIVNVDVNAGAPVFDNDGNGFRTLNYPRGRMRTRNSNSDQQDEYYDDENKENINYTAAGHSGYDDEGGNDENITFTQQQQDEG